uniref:Photosystem I reaction center subunit VI n=1 Tax=Aegilops tauschii subsp. strangulata TaxID=200361 RepID=A0A452ZVW7_AEGTS
MASLVAVQPVAVRGLAGSSISGRKLAVRPASAAVSRSTRRYLTRLTNTRTI